MLSVSGLRDVCQAFLESLKKTYVSYNYSWVLSCMDGETLIIIIFCINYSLCVFVCNESLRYMCDICGAFSESDSWQKHMQKNGG